jgi:hypothetical protein
MGFQEKAVRVALAAAGDKLEPALEQLQVCMSGLHRDAKPFTVSCVERPGGRWQLARPRCLLLAYASGRRGGGGVALGK